MRFPIFLLLAPLAFLAAKEKTQPNFVIFLTDDLGWGDLACYGHPVIKTPNLDRFAKQGTKFTQCYSACAVCSPSRSAILTGRTPYRNGVWRWIPGGHRVHLRESEVTLAELLKEEGYATCHVGKWHLNGKFNSKDQPQPDDHGFDHWLATQNNAAPSHKNPKNFVLNGKELGELEGYSAPLVVEEGIRWLKKIRDPKKPFFLNVWTHEPHLPIESDPKFMDLYKEFDDEGIRQHHGNVTQIDHAFGNLMKALDEMGLAENTFVFFTSDNGPEGPPEACANASALPTRAASASPASPVGRARSRPTSRTGPPSSDRTCSPPSSAFWTFLRPATEPSTGPTSCPFSRARRSRGKSPFTGATTWPAGRFASPYGTGIGKSSATRD